MTAPRPQPGQRFGPFDVLSTLDPLGQAFRVRTPPGDERLLMLVPREEAAPLRAVAAVAHPGLQPILEVGEDEEDAWILTAPEGELLRRRLERGPLPPAEVARVGAQLARGLSALHQRGFSYGTLHPGLVELTPAGARLLPPLARTGTRAWSLAHSGGGRADARSDLFALGEVLFECLTGRSTLPGEAEAGPPSGPLARLISRCLEKSPEERFQAAADLAFALEGLQEPEPVPVAPPPRRARLMVLGAVVLLAVSGATLGLRRLAAPPVGLLAHEVRVRTLVTAQGLHLRARFDPDGRSVVYAAALEGRAPQVFSSRLDGVESRAVSPPFFTLTDVFASGALALTRISPNFLNSATPELWLGNLAGGAPRPWLDAVRGASFAPDGGLLVVRVRDGVPVFELPPGQRLNGLEGMQVRLSPDGRYLGLESHPIPGNQIGAMEIRELDGGLVARSREVGSVGGFAWSADGGELWFTATNMHIRRDLFALALDGSERQVLASVGSLTLEDIDRHGRVLATVGTERSIARGRVGNPPRDRPLSWMDATIPMYLSPDGQAFLFIEGTGPNGGNEEAWLQRFDAASDTPVFVGEGVGMVLSADKRWVLLAAGFQFNHLRLMPTGAGQPWDFPGGEFRFLAGGAFLPDASVLFSAADRDGRIHLYQQTPWVDAGPQRLDEEPFQLRILSPDGEWLAGWHRGRSVLRSMRTGERRVLPGLEPLDFLTGWTADGAGLWVVRRRIGERPEAQLLRYALDGGTLTLLERLSPTDPAGMVVVHAPLLTPDAGHLVYQYEEYRTELVLLEGLR